MKSISMKYMKVIEIMSPIRPIITTIRRPIISESLSKHVDVIETPMRNIDPNKPIL